MTKIQCLALRFYERASRYRVVLHDAQRCQLDKRWQHVLWTSREDYIIDATTLAPEIFEFWEDERYPGMVCVVCRITGVRTHFPRRKAHLLRCSYAT